MGKIAEKLYYRWFGQSKPKATHRRQYAASRLNTANADWVTQPTVSNWELYSSLRPLRARARQMARDNSHFKKFLSMCRSNIVGRKGIQLQSNARKLDGSLDAEINSQVEEAWRLWGHKETCTLSGKLSWRGVQRMIVTQLAQDGEFLVQKIPAKNAFGFSLKVINVDYLDEYYNATLPNGNRIIMSVEVDDNDKPVTYWLTPPVSDIYAKRTKVRRVPVPAEQMIHGFLSFIDESQTRGVTWFHAAILDGKNYQGYSGGVIQSARMAACIPFFFEQTVPDEAPAYEGKDDPATGEKTTPTLDVGAFGANLLDPGITFKQFDPKQPTMNHSAFAKTVLMDVATGLDVPYFDLSGDMEAVNFSSSRVGLDTSRDIWRGLQDFIIDEFCRDVFHGWALNAFLSDKLQMTAQEFEEIQNPEWRARGWKYIDPTKDVAADILRLANNMTSLEDVLGEQGEKPIDLFRKIKANKELAAEFGIDLVYVSSVKVADAGTAPEDDSGPPAKDTSTPKRGYTNGEIHEEFPN